MAEDDKNDNSVKSPVIKRMLRNYKLSADAEADNRKRALIALEFRRGGQAQWDKQIWNDRGESNRPRESFNQVPQFLHQVTNDMRQNMPQTRFVPGNDGTKEVADIYEDKARNIQASSEGEIAYDNAADSQVAIGWGYWRYVTEYESDDTFDQEIKVKWVPNPLAVYDDPHATEQDYSDRKFLIHVFDLAKDDFNDQYDKDYEDSDLESIGDAAPDWAGSETIRVAEYWELTYTKTTKKRTIDGKEEEREVLKPKVMWFKCTATEVLEQKEWPGIYIPYVKPLGNMNIINGTTYLSGLIEGMIPAQRMYNYWTNTATEIMGMVPLSPWIAAIDQIPQGPISQMWDASNVKKFPYLLYNPAAGPNGEMMPAPQRNSASADISGALALTERAQENFYTTTGIYPAALGRQSNETSGKAINARKVEGEVSNFHYMDNMARALRFGGRILADLFPKIYDGSRKIRLLKEDGTNREVQINQKYKDERGKEQNFDMTVGTYDVMVTTGPNFTTRRQESADAMLTLAQSTNLMEVAPDIVYSNQDWPGADKIAERYKKTLPPQLTEDDEESPIPPQVAMQMQQMQQVMQELQEQLGQAEQALQDKQADIENKNADLQLKQQEMAYSAQSDQMKAENDRLKIQLDAEKLQFEREKAEVEALRLQVEGVQAQMQPAQNNTQNEPEEDVMALGKEQLQARLQEIEQQEAMEQEQQAQAQMQQQQMMEQQQMKEAEDRARSDALLENLMGIRRGLDALMTSIVAPKTVVRDENGMIQGVVTQTGTLQ